jgi:hypothetical protein
MPFVLSKMHDRYFYAFEIMPIVRACVDSRYIAFAVIAQVDGILSYLAFDQGILLGVRLAAVANATMLFFILRELVRRPTLASARFSAGAGAGYGGVIAVTALFMPWTAHGMPGLAWEIGYAALLVPTGAAAAVLVSQSVGGLPPGSAAEETRGPRPF